MPRCLKKVVPLLLVLIFTGSAKADGNTPYFYIQELIQGYNTNTIYVKTQGSPSTCSPCGATYGCNYFVLQDDSTYNGSHSGDWFKQKYTLLLAAYMAGKQVQLFWATSGAQNCQSNSTANYPIISQVYIEP
jgi:hypothetical protein